MNDQNCKSFINPWKIYHGRISAMIIILMMRLKNFQNYTNQLLKQTFLKKLWEVALIKKKKSMDDEMHTKVSEK